jgi:hypothetical protein
MLAKGSCARGERRLRRRAHLDEVMVGGGSLR